MNNHDSHIISEFSLLAADNHIRSYFFIPHLTHCMQFLDVAVFQPYKHWHNDAIKQIMAEFNLEYSMARFCEDLTKIRNNTFKKFTIQFVFEKSDMYFLDFVNCISFFRKFVPGILQKKIAKMNCFFQLHMQSHFSNRNYPAFDPKRCMTLRLN